MLLILEIANNATKITSYIGICNDNNDVIERKYCLSANTNVSWETAPGQIDINIAQVNK